ncbi:MAG TPA: histidinol dehydrogenase, partial [Orrella sp.]
MAVVNRLSTQDPGFDQTLTALLHVNAAEDDAIESAAAGILQAIRIEGDAALLRYTQQFDRVSTSSVAELEIPRRAWQAALDELPAAQRRALEEAAERIRSYHERQKQDSWTFTEANGTVLGQKITPLDRGGLYVPGGKAAYPSSVLMNVIPAKVAGVTEVIMVTPTPDG